MTANEPRPRWDPLGHGIALPLRETFYPLGYRLDLLSNHPAALEAARWSWPESAGAGVAAPPLRMEIIVSEGGRLSSAPRYRARGRKLTAVADAENHAAADLENGSIVCWVSEATATAADRLRRFDHLRRFYLEGLVYQTLSCRFLAPIHASCVARDGRGLLLSGPSGAGKSSLALACARAGWRFVSDDVTYARRDRPEILLGRSRWLRLKPGARMLFPELVDFEERPDPDGGEAFELRAVEDLQLATAGECEVAATIFLERTVGAAELQPVPAEQAFERLPADLPLADPETADAQVRTLRRVVSRGAWRLTYGDLKEAVGLLEGLVRG